MNDFERAAEARRSMYRAAKDRPMQRRSLITHGGRPAAQFRAQMRFMTGGDLNPAPGMVPAAGGWTAGDDGSNGVDELFFVGLASSTNSPYEMYDQAGPYHEIVAAGAFRSSLSLGAGLDVPLVIQHDDARRIARTTIPSGQPGHLELTESTEGLMCRAQLDPNDPDVAYIMPKIQSGLMSEMSFRFEITSGEWSPDFSQYVISSANLQRGDVSIVGYGANPNTFAALAQRGASRPLSETAERELYRQLAAKYDMPERKKTFLVRDDDLR